MIERIAAKDVRTGMFIVGFEGSWFSHPFWRKNFVLSNDEDVQRIRECSADAVLIDTARGTIMPASATMPAQNRSVEPARHNRIRWAAMIPRRETSGEDTQAADRAAATRTVGRCKAVMQQVFDGARLGKAIRSADVGAVVDEISDSLDRNRSALLGITRLKSKDEYTYLHSVAVCALMVNLARELGLPDSEVRELGLAGLLHDVGKMTVEDSILNKPGQLTSAEFEEIKCHTSRGHALLSEGDGVPETALDVCLHHHEKMDGTGYPFRLGSDRISRAARMGAICDVYDAMTSNRSYKTAWSPADTVEAMLSWDGHFDRPMLFRFMRSIGVYPTGVLVQLRTNRLAVALPNGRRASRPKFRVFYALADRATLPYEDITISDTLSGDQVVAEGDATRAGIGDWGKARDAILAGQPLPG